MLSIFKRQEFLESKGFKKFFTQKRIAYPSLQNFHSNTEDKIFCKILDVHALVIYIHTHLPREEHKRIS